jgi:hypothetical protein
MKTIVSSNSTTFGVFCSLLLGLVIAGSVFRWMMPRFGAGAALVIGSVGFAFCYICFCRCINVRRFTFDRSARNIKVEERWVVAIRGRLEFHCFDDIREISLRAREQSDAIVALHSGKYLHLKTGRLRQVVHCCDEIAAVTGKSEVTPGR